MAASLPTFVGSFSPGTRGRHWNGWIGTVNAQRLPTDPLFYATLTLQNIVVGSRYRITRHDTGGQLATGVAGSGAEVISGVPCFDSPMRVDVSVRNASGGAKYKPFETAAFMVPLGASAYILQQLD